MLNYVLIFGLLLLATMILYYLYDKYFTAKSIVSSETYVDALKDLLDGRQEQAFSKLRQVVLEDSTNVDAYIRLGIILRDNNKPEQALQVHKDLTLRAGLAPELKAEILKQLYLDYILLEEFDTAEAALKELVTIKPKSRWAVIKLLEMQKEQKKWDDAYNTAVQLLKIEENKSKKPLASFKYEMGHQLFKKREYHKARILFKEAIGYDNNFADAYLAIGDSYSEEGRFEDAVNFWTKLISNVPDKGHLVLDRLKKVLFDLGRYGEVEQICRNIMAHSPKNQIARHCLAEFYEKKGDTDLAEEILNSVIDDHPDDVKSVVELIRIHLENKDNQKIYSLLKTVNKKMQKKVVSKFPNLTSV